jgi:hypothetical protein
MPAMVSDGSEDEAVEYVAWSRETWSETTGALEWLHKVRDCLNARTSRPSHKVWKNSMESAGRAHEAEQYNKAKGHLLYALRQCQNFGEDEFLFHTWLELAATWVWLDPVAKDEEIFQRPVRLGVQLYGEVSCQVAMALLHLGLFFAECGKWKKSELALVRAERIAEALGVEDLHAAIVVSLANAYDSQGKVELGKQCRERAEDLYDELEEDNRGYGADDNSPFGWMQSSFSTTITPSLN